MGTATRNSTKDTTGKIEVQSSTYNSFIAAGYKEDGSVNGVYLKDIKTLCGVDDTQYIITNNNDTIYLNTYIGTNTSVVVPFSRG